MKPEKQKVAAIIVAAGESSRMGSTDKMFARLGGKTILARTVDAFQQSALIDRIILVVNAKNVARVNRLVTANQWGKVTDVCAGGTRRQDSVAEGLKKLRDEEWVLIHDGARPRVTPDLIQRGLEAARETGAAVAAVPVKDTIKAAEADGTVRQTLPRQNLWAVQTPQVFRVGIIKKAHEAVNDEATDDAALAEKAGYKVKLYAGSYDNIKVTTPEDLALARVLLKKKDAK